MARANLALKGKVGVTFFLDFVRFSPNSFCDDIKGLSFAALGFAGPFLKLNIASNMALNSTSGGYAGSPWRSIAAQSIKSRRSSNEERRPTPELSNANASCPRCDMLTSIHDRDQGIKNFTHRPLPSAHRVSYKIIRQAFSTHVASYPAAVR